MAGAYEYEDGWNALHVNVVSQRRTEEERRTASSLFNVPFEEIHIVLVVCSRSKTVLLYTVLMMMDA